MANNKGSNSNSKQTTRTGSVASDHDYSRFQLLLVYVNIILGSVALLVSVKYAYDGKLNVLQPRNIDFTSLETFSGRLEFSVKYWVLPLIWLYFSYHVVMLRRLFSKAINPLAGHEEKVQASKNILTNSIEQFVLLISSQIVVVAFLTPVLTVRLVPLVNAWYLVGRVLFWLGYPKMRTFGMVTTALSSSVCIWYSIYWFFSSFLDPNQIISFGLGKVLPSNKVLPTK